MSVYEYTMPQQRLGNKTLFSTAVKKNTGSVRYFSGCDAEIYFEDIYVDEATQIEFTVQQNTLPLFGYNSYIYDDVAVGSRIIQGRFAINFTKANFLYDVMNTITTITNQLQKTPAQIEHTLEEFDKIHEDDQITNATFERASWEKKPLWDQGFNMVVSYGDAYRNNEPNSTMVVLTGVRITGVSQAFGFTGEPIQEVYTFLARDIEFVPSNTKSTTTTVLPETLQKELFRFTVLTYSEAVEGTTTKKAVGQIQINYDADASISVTSIKLKPYMPNATGDKKSDYEDIKVTNPSSYNVPDIIRQYIKTYHGDGKLEKKNYIDVDFIVSYKKDGKNVDKTLREHVTIKNIVYGL